MLAIELTASPIGLLFAFLGGVISILSPCVLPILPALFGVVSGSSIDELQNEEKLARKVIKICLLFTVGFSFVFVLIVLLTTSLSELFVKNSDTATRIGGFFILIFAAILILNQTTKVTLFNTEKRPLLKGAFIDSSAIIAGAAFAFGWSPCLGPILAAVIAYAQTSQSIFSRTAIAFAYCLGLCFAMTLIVYFTLKSHRVVQFLQRNTNVFVWVAIVIMSFFGFILLFDKMNLLTSALSDLLSFIGLDRLVTVG